MRVYGQYAGKGWYAFEPVVLRSGKVVWALSRLCNYHEAEENVQQMAAARRWYLPQRIDNKHLYNLLVYRDDLDWIGELHKELKEKEKEYAQAQ